MPDISESSLEEPPKICAFLELTKNLQKNTVSPLVQQTNFVTKLGKVKHTLLFAVLLNDEDETESPDLSRGQQGYLLMDNIKSS